MFGVVDEYREALDLLLSLCPDLRRNRMDPNGEAKQAHTYLKAKLVELKKLEDKQYCDDFNGKVTKHFRD
jgi:hypothetical protein